MSDVRHGFIDSYDIPILRTMPAQGSLVGKYKPLAITARIIRQRLDNEYTAAEINGRLRSLKALGYVVDVVVLPSNQGMGWQITPEGDRKLAALKLTTTWRAV